jgi:hypothetical protein
VARRAQRVDRTVEAFRGTRGAKGVIICRLRHAEAQGLVDWAHDYL